MAAIQNVQVFPVLKILCHEAVAGSPLARVPEPDHLMEDPEQVAAYVQAYEVGTATESLVLHHLRELSLLIRPGDTVLDLACGPGSLLLDLAAIFPETHFVGVDLSALMLEHLRRRAEERQLLNVTTKCEDIAFLPSVADGSVDLVITTSSLHHLPNRELLRQTFARVHTVLNATGGLYAFDFGLLRSEDSMDLCVAQVASSVPALTAADYAHSLRAAFPVSEVIELARQELPRPFSFSRSAFFDFVYFLQTPPRAEPSERVTKAIAERLANMLRANRWEHRLLRWARRRVRFPGVSDLRAGHLNA